jgi:hypothetical protein
MKTGSPVVVVLLAVVSFVWCIAAVSAPQSVRKQEVTIPELGVTMRAGWRVLLYEGCQFATPASWVQHSEDGVLSAPDGSTLSTAVTTLTNWIDHKAAIMAAYGHDAVVHENSSRRLWLERRDGPIALHHIEVIAGNRSCVAMLTIHVETSSGIDIQQIVAGVGPAPPGVPPNQ